MQIYGGEGNGNLLQYCLENPRDRGAWQAMVHSVAESWTRLKQLSTHTHTRVYMESRNMALLKLFTGREEMEMKT